MRCATSTKDFGWGRLSKPAGETIMRRYFFFGWLLGRRKRFARYTSRRRNLRSEVGGHSTGPLSGMRCMIVCAN